MAHWINLVFLLLKRIFLAKEVYSDESLKQKQKVGSSDKVQISV